MSILDDSRSEEAKSKLTTAECARVLGMSTDFVRGEVRDGRLKADVWKGGGRKRARYRVNLADFKNYLAKYWPLHDSPVVSSQAIEGVYFVKGGDLVKIGCSYDIEGRVTSLKCDSPVPLELVRVVRTKPRQKPTELESRFHQMFASLRHHGEWFKLEGALKAFCESNDQPEEIAS